MTQKVYMLSSDQGDGSATVHFFRNKPDLEKMFEEDEYALEQYSANEEPLDYLEFPDDLDLSTCGFYFVD
jgi:hypothetical protein